MSGFPIPAERIHLKMAGVPQEMAELTALALAEAVKFCAQPETFPVFQRWAQQDVTPNTGGDIYAQVISRMVPGVLLDIEQMIAAGMVADMEAGQ